MPRVHPGQFGDLDYEEESCVLFPRGLPGFEQCRRFVLLEPPELAPLVQMQSLEIPDLCFLALPARSVAPDYDVALTPEDFLTLGSARPTLDLALLSVGVEGTVTANLLAPVVINLATRVAVQAVRGDFQYSHQHPVGEVSPCL